MNGDGNNGNLLFEAYIGMSAIAGSIVSLSLRPWRKMTGWELGMALFVGFSFGVLAVPYIVVDVMKVSSYLTSVRAACFFTFCGSAFAFLALPSIWRATAKRFGLPSAEDEA